MNKRIQKKRAKAEMQRDKSKVIASMMVMLDSERPRYEQIKIAKRLWKMSLDELFALSEKVIRVWVCYHSPLRPMIPRTPNGHIPAPWRTITTDFSNTEVK